MREGGSGPTERDGVISININRESTGIALLVVVSLVVLFLASVPLVQDWVLVAFWSVVFGVAILWDKWHASFALLASLFLFAPGKPSDSWVSVTDVIIVLFLLRIALSAKGLQIRDTLRGDRKEEIALLSLVLIAFVSLVIVKVTGGNVGEGGKAALRLGEYFVVYYCCSRMLEGNGSAERLEQAIAVLGVVFGLLGVLQFALGPEESARSFAWGPSWTSGYQTDQFRVYSVFSNPINFSAFCAALVPFALDRLRGNGTLNKVLFSSLFVASAACLALAGSRTGVVCALLGIMVSLRLRIRHWLGPLAICGLLVLVGITRNVGERLFLETDESILNILGRVASARDALQLIADHPLRGVGIGQYPEVVMKSFRGNVSGDEYEALTAENTFLQFGAEMGLPGMCALFGLEALLLWRCRRLLYRPGGGSGLLGAAVALFVANFFATLTAASSMFFLILLLALAKKKSLPAPGVHRNVPAHATQAWMTAREA